MIKDLQKEYELDDTQFERNIVDSIKELCHETIKTYGRRSPIAKQYRFINAKANINLMHVLANSLDFEKAFTRSLTREQLHDTCTLYYPNFYKKLTSTPGQNAIKLFNAGNTEQKKEAVNAFKNYVFDRYGNNYSILRNTSNK